MKSFWFSLAPPPAPLPPRVVEDYTAEERQAFRKTYETLAARYRRRLNTVFKIYGAALLGCLLLFGATRPAHPHLILIGALALFFLVLVTIMAIFIVLPRCPACGNSLEDGLGAYCPECGARSVTQKGWFGNAECASCGRSLRFAKSRCFKIRACTHCGVMLDEEGL